MCVTYFGEKQKNIRKFRRNALDRENHGGGGILMDYPGKKHSVEGGPK